MTCPAGSTQSDLSRELELFLELLANMARAALFYLSLALCVACCTAATWLHADGVPASAWLQPILVSGFGLGAAAALAVIARLAVGTAGAMRKTLQQRDAGKGSEWDALINGLADAIVEAFSDDDLDAEEIATTLETRVRACVCEETGPASSSSEAGLGEGTEAAENPWLAAQPGPVQLFVRRVERKDGRWWVTCKCGGPAMRAGHFRWHVVSETHEDEFFAAMNAAEKNAAAFALEAAAGLIAELAQRSHEAAEASASLEVMQRELQAARSAAYYFENRATNTDRAIKKLSATSRRLCPTAKLHQELHDAGTFNEPVAATAQEVWHDVLKRLQLGEKLGRGGKAAHLESASVRALWLYVYNNGRTCLLRMFQGLLRAPQAKYLSRLHHEEFAEPGHPRQFAQRAAAFCRDIGYSPEQGMFVLNWDPAKMQAKFELDQKRNRFMGHVDFNTDLAFNGYQDWADFRESKVAAGYIMPFCLCPCDPALPSAISVAALIPTDLTYTILSLKGYLSAIRANLQDAGFRYIIVYGADNASVHRSLLLQLSIPANAPAAAASASATAADGDAATPADVDDEVDPSMPDLEDVDVDAADAAASPAAPPPAAAPAVTPALGDEIGSIATLRGFSTAGAARAPAPPNTISCRSPLTLCGSSGARRQATSAPPWPSWIRPTAPRMRA